MQANIEGIDYRIADISFKSDLRIAYNYFVKKNHERAAKGDRNEFEPEALFVEDIERNIGFELKTLIILFFPYLDNEKIKQSTISNLSVHAMSLDYHKICARYMDQIQDSFDDLEANFYIQCDIGHFNERFFAINTGLCMQAVNAMAIHSVYGTYGFLGIIATDRRIEPYTSPKTHCINCSRCIKNCPAGAITRENLDGNKCLSYLTQKKLLTYEDTQLLQKHSKIYGCDICQLVCPENFGIKYTKIKDFNENLLYNIRLEEIVSLSNKEFKRKYYNRNFSWRGKNVILRNLNLLEK